MNGPPEMIAVSPLFDDSNASIQGGCTLRTEAAEAAIPNTRSAKKLGLVLKFIED